MKYKDPTTGDFKTIKIRATDELPVGSIVDYDGLATDIPSGWESYGNNQIKKVSETTPVTGNVINGYSESTTDGYSCNYINELNTYSTDEQVVGTWIDGRPIYRKAVSNLSVTTNPNAWNDILDTSSMNIDNLVDVKPYTYEFKILRTGFYKISNAILSAFINNASNSHFEINSVIIEYTKTTD